MVGFPESNFIPYIHNLYYIKPLFTIVISQLN